MFYIICLEPCANTAQSQHLGVFPIKKSVFPVDFAISRRIINTNYWIGPVFPQRNQEKRDSLGEKRINGNPTCKTPENKEELTRMRQIYRNLKGKLMNPQAKAFNSSKIAKKLTVSPQIS